MTRNASVLMVILHCLLFSFSAYAETGTSVNPEKRSPFQVDNIPTPLSHSGNKTDTLLLVSLTLNKDKLLSQEIQGWADKYGFRPLWNSSRDYIIYNTITLTGKTTDDVLTQLGQVFSSEHYGLVIKLYEKNNVLVIDAQ